MTVDRRAEMSQPIRDVVRRWVDELINQGDLDVVDEIYVPLLAASARQWVTSFRASFPDVHMQVITIVAEDDQGVGRFTCSATHTGTWRGHPPTGRRFENIDEVYFFRVLAGRLVDMWSIEDTHERLRQLGLSWRDRTPRPRAGGRSAWYDGATAP
jgi:predicted ester cyclase